MPLPSLPHPSIDLLTELSAAPEGEEQRPHLLLRFPLLCLPRKRRQAGSHILQAGDPPVGQTIWGATPAALAVGRVRRWLVRGGGDRWRSLDVGWMLDGGGGGGGGCGFSEGDAAGEEEREVGEVPSSVVRMGYEDGEIFGETPAGLRERVGRVGRVGAGFGFKHLIAHTTQAFHTSTRWQPL